MKLHFSKVIRAFLCLFLITFSMNSNAGSGGPAAWSHLGHTRPWTKVVHELVKQNLARLERARDKNEFCPGYSAASPEQKETCWVRMVSAIAKFESNFNPSQSFDEPMGMASVGLLQLSEGECPNAPDEEALKNPIKNLACGTKMMADFIARDGYITSPDNHHGAATYWSVIRNPYEYGDMELGKKPEIIAITKEYRNVQPVGPGWEFWE